MVEFNILNLKPNCHVHFVGIGGISMSALAQILLSMGFIITGSDLKDSNITQKLENMGIKVFIGHDSSNISGADVIVYTAAVKSDNPEIIYAKEKKLTIVERSTLLGEIMRKYKYSIGVSGTHGKTTTTSMISLILMAANFDPTITVGGEVNQIGGNLRIGSSGYFVTEACEYVENFLKFHPFVGIILNVDEDHLDYFKDIDNITEAFIKYAKLIPKDGSLIINNDDQRKEQIINSVNCNVITYGINNDSDYQASNIEYNSLGFPKFKVLRNANLLGEIQLKIPGIHNVYNALAAIACCISLNVDFNSCINGLSSFNGAKRRFEYKGAFNNIAVIDDYAHHPTEVSATLSAAKNYPHNKIWCIFQPHTYSRTKKLLKEFSQAFFDADKIIITDIYAAREKDTGDIHSKNLVEKIIQNQKEVFYLKDFDDIKEYIINNANSGDLIITMGAGDIYKVGEMLLNK